MRLKIGTIEYRVNDEVFYVEVDVHKIKCTSYEEKAGHKEPNYITEVVEFQVDTEYGMIKGKASSTNNEYNYDIELTMDNELIEILPPECIVEDEDE